MSDHETARRSYALRQRRVADSAEALDQAKAELDQLFNTVFAYPDAAKAKFADLVRRVGLQRASAKFASKPTDIVPGWKALRGEHDVFSGPSRERERARELLAKLPEYYRAAENAQQKHTLAARLFVDAQNYLSGLQAALPIAEPTPYSYPPRRKLGQKQRL